MEYTVQKNDNLTKIAKEHGYTVDDIIASNPNLESDPDTIMVGQTVSLPEQNFDETSDTQLCNEADPQCKGAEAYSLVYFSGEGPEKMCLLDSVQTNELKVEISTVEAMMKEFGRIVASADSDENTAQKKRDWLIKAAREGLIDYDPPTEENAEDLVKKPDEEVTLMGKITALEKEEKYLSGYTPFLEAHFSTDYSVNWKKLKTRRIQAIKKKIKEHESVLVTLKGALSKPTETNAKAVMPTSNSKKKSAATWKSRGFQELIMITAEGDSKSWGYVRKDFADKKRTAWSRLTSVENVRAALPKKSDSTNRTDYAKKIGAALAKDIKKSIKDDAQKSPLGNIEAKLVTWNAPGFLVFDDLEFKASSSSGDDKGDVQHELNAEAQMLRFAAQASAGVNAFDLNKGEVDIGAKGQASFSLAEGKISYDNYYPSKKGYNASLVFTNANGVEEYMYFGHFRCHAMLILSAFVGATCSAKAEIRTSIGGRNQTSHQVALNGNTGGGEALLAPQVRSSTSRGGSVGVQGDGFAGAQCGGVLAGNIEWESPENWDQDSFKSLVGIKTEGNLALGGGLGFDFEIALTREGKFQFNCHARLVWGLGASGGFGVEVDGEQIWELLIIVYQCLERLDYRKWKNLTLEAFNQCNRIIIYTLTQPAAAFSHTAQMLRGEIDAWWKVRCEGIEIERVKIQEAKQLAKNINTEATFNELNINLLLPESIGVMLNTLLPTQLFGFEEAQERAIITLLSSITSWRKFEEVLARINATGSKVEGEEAIFENFNRLNGILDLREKKEFNEWMSQLALSDQRDESKSMMLAYTTTPFNQKRELIEYQLARLNTHRSQAYA